MADESDCGITLCYLPLKEGACPPKFKECARRPKVSEPGFVLYYTDQCPFTYYWVPRVAKTAAEHGIAIKVIHVTDKEAAENMPRRRSRTTRFSGTGNLSRTRYSPTRSSCRSPACEEVRLCKVKMR